jgi:hypothetical protein
MQGEHDADLVNGTQRATLKDLTSGIGAQYLKQLLRHYRPDFDRMPVLDQIALMVKAVEKTNGFLKALHELLRCLQNADPDEGLSNTPVRQAARDVKAAQLRDINGLSWVEIGRRVGADQSESDRIRGDNKQVRTRIVPNGRTHLAAVLGGVERYEAFVESRKAQLERWQSLSPAERFAEVVSERDGVPADLVRMAITLPFETVLEKLEGLDADKADVLLGARQLWRTISASDDTHG